MKTAEDWIAQFEANDANHTAGSICAEIRDIQADALRHAAGLCLDRCKDTKVTSKPSAREALACGQAIEAEATKLEPK